MRVKKTTTVKLADLKLNLFVRQELDQDHVWYLTQLIENGTKLPPIDITEDNSVVDGRHRIEAYELNKIEEIEARVLVFENQSEMIAYAFRANGSDGPKRPTVQDTEHTVELLLENSETIKNIAELLALPPSLTRKFVTEIKSRLNRIKIQKARNAVSEGRLTTPKAAEEYGVDLEKLKEVLSGTRRGAKKGVAELQRALTSNYKTLGLKSAAAVRRLLDKFEDGDVSEKQVREIFKHLDDLMKRSRRSMSDWEKRFEAKVNPTKTEEKSAKVA